MAFKNLVPFLLPQIQDFRLPGLDGEDGFIYPNYQATTIANLPSSICHWLGIPAFGLPSLPSSWLEPITGPFQRVVLLLVDALSLDFFLNQIQIEEKNNPWRKMLASSVLMPITSVAPSTTVSALTSLWTGQPPSVHGMLGYELWLKEYGIVSNMIFQSPASFSGDPGGLRKAGFQPENFLNAPIFGGHLAQHSVTSYALMHSTIASSTLSAMHFRQTKVLTYRTLSDMWVSLTTLFDDHPDEHSYTHIYWGDLDELGHRYGPGDDRLKLEMSILGMLLEKVFVRSKKKGHGETLFLLTADHGQISTPLKPLNDLRRHPEMRASLTMLPTGEGRMAYLYPRPGQEEHLINYIEQIWPGEFTVLPSSQVLQAGLFGSKPFHPRASERIGDWVAVARKDSFWWWPERENTMLGRHGSLTPKEMLVPLLGFIL